MKNFVLILSFIFVAVLTFSCKKETFITSSDARLSLSTDTIKFDTVFTQTGSITRTFKIFNNNDQKLRLTSIELKGGNSSPFRININGVAAISQTNISLAANDSMYIFVTVNINPTQANLPFILADSIRIEYNGNIRWVQLQAYGQNAVFLNNAVVSANTSFTNAKPYVILGSLEIKPGITLTLNEGVKIYAHANAPILVDGTMIVNGTVTNPILFTGDRLDDPYDKFPASWPGIYLRAASINNIFSFAQVKNANQGIVVTGQSQNGNPKLVLHQSIISNASDAGLLCNNSSVNVDNTLIYNSGSNLLIKSGGTYNFTNCTFAGYSNNYQFHKTPVAQLYNFDEFNGTTITAALNASFKNCILWGENGSLENEILLQKQGTTAFSVTLDHCLYKADSEPAGAIIAASLRNIDPQFDSLDIRNNIYNFRTTKEPSSPVVSAGAATTFPRDLDNKPRNPVNPDIGAYEKQ